MLADIVLWFCYSLCFLLLISTRDIIKVSIYTDIPDIDIRENTTNNSQAFTAVLTSFPAPIQVQWTMKDEATGDWAPIDVNSEEYSGTTNSLPQPVLVVKRMERIKMHSFQIEVKNFIGTKRKLIPGTLLSYYIKTSCLFQ